MYLISNSNASIMWAEYIKLYVEQDLRYNSYIINNIGYFKLYVEQDLRYNSYVINNIGYFKLYVQQDLRYNSYVKSI